MIDSALNKDHYSFQPNKGAGQDVCSKYSLDHLHRQKTVPQNKLAWLADKIRQHKTITTLVLAFCILVAILTPLIHMGSEQTVIALITSSYLNMPLKSGISMKSSLLEVIKQSKKVNITVNSLGPSHATRLLQQDTPTSRIFSYYHKDSEIFVSFSSKFTSQIRIPETAIDFVIPSVPQQSEQAFYQMPMQLPVALIKGLSQVSGQKVTISTDVSYDGVYNKTNNQYTLLTHRRPYYPEEFGKVEPDELNLLEIKPKITNFSDIIEVTSKITAVVANIANNAKQIILQNKEKLMKLFGSSNNKAAHHKGILVQADKLLRCGRLSEGVMRCPESVWRSGELNVKNINDPDPVQVLEIVIDIQ